MISKLTNYKSLYLLLYYCRVEVNMKLVSSIHSDPNVNKLSPYEIFDQFGSIINDVISNFSVKVLTTDNLSFWKFKLSVIHFLTRTRSATR